MHGRADYNGRIIDTEGRIPADEPVLLIRGKDAVAPDAARAYAALAKAMGAPACVVQRVSDQADAMEAYQRRVGSRMPD
ncbi:MAG: hypothetical protein ACJ8DZ_13880 [Allosphingosinicella sp.]